MEFSPDSEPLPLLDRFYPYATIEQGWAIEKLMRSGFYSFSRYMLNEDNHKAVAVLESSHDVVIVYPDGYKDLRPDKTVEVVRDF